MQSVAVCGEVLQSGSSSHRNSSITPHHTATQCITWQHTLQHIAACYSTLHHAATRCNTLQQLQHTATHIATRTVRHCNALSLTAEICNAQKAKLTTA